MKHCFALLLLLLAANSALAVVFQQSGPQGNIIFSDIPMSKDAKVIRHPTSRENTVTTPANVKEAPSTNESSVSIDATTATTTPAPKPYVRFTLISPEDGESIQNQPVIYVNFDVDPPLQSGDMIQVFLDAKPWGQALATTHFSFTAPDRGTHYLYGVLLAKDQRILKQSARITIYVHQAHIPTQPPRPNNTM